MWRLCERWPSQCNSLRSKLLAHIIWLTSLCYFCLHFVLVAKEFTLRKRWQIKRKMSAIKHCPVSKTTTTFKIVKIHSCQKKPTPLSLVPNISKTNQTRWEQFLPFTYSMKDSVFLFSTREKRAHKNKSLFGQKRFLALRADCLRIWQI